MRISGAETTKAIPLFSPSSAEDSATVAEVAKGLPSNGNSAEDSATVADNHKGAAEHWELSRG